MFQLLGAKPRSGPGNTVEIVVDDLLTLGNLPYVVPSGVSHMDIVAIGAGGNGCTADYEIIGDLIIPGGAGGGGGGYLKFVGIPVTPGDTISFTLQPVSTYAYIHIELNSFTGASVVCGSNPTTGQNSNKIYASNQVLGWSSYVVMDFPSPSTTWPELGSAYLLPVGQSGTLMPGVGAPGWTLDGQPTDPTPAVGPYQNANDGFAYGGGGGGATTGYHNGTGHPGIIRIRLYNTP